MFIFKIVTLLNALIFNFKEANSNHEVTSNIKGDHSFTSNDAYPTHCADLMGFNDTQSGIRKIYPNPFLINKSVKVFCDQETDGGGWTVIQYHIDKNQTRENFYRRWTEYKLGFGYLNNEFWLGLDNIHALVKNSQMELRVDLEDYEGDARWAKYDYFYISDEAGKYRLDFGKYSGNSGDALRSHIGMKFTTNDQDNDLGGQNCATEFKGAWWYRNCQDVSLNGLPHRGKHFPNGVGINWYTFRGNMYSLKKARLSIRPKFI